jgi:hypothetical protein
LEENLQDTDIFIAPVNLNEDRALALKTARTVGSPSNIYLFPDPSQIKAFIMGPLPAAYILDSRGFLRASVQGSIPWTEADIEKSLRELLAN